jgi:GTP diphosphokinase / guanosine-3',5'-bis(diphosphate) 3'-diphosphatase
MKKHHILLPLEHYRDILTQHISSYNSESKVIFDALAFAYKHHAGCFRKSGEPYFNHPVAVAEILLKDLFIKDPQLLSAALLHDVVEDVASVALRDIESLFGNTVATLVDGCTKLQLQQKDRATQSDLTHSKIFLSASRQLGVLLIKLADRLHNMQTLASLPEAKRRRIAFETIRVYAPIAAKLNLYTLKRNLYNLALAYLFPRKSKKIISVTKELFCSKGVDEITHRLMEIISKGPHAFSIRPRVKGLGSFYSHLRQTIDLNNAENLVDFTVVLDTADPLDCYPVLGRINQHLKPVPKSIRDIIANPKPNGYQSLHVRINQQGRDYLIKIRTREMDLNANSGMRYQWDTVHIQESYWGEISDLLRNIGEYGGDGSQRKNLIQLSDTAEVFAYTPDGDIHYFPRGSIVIDFAYKIHSDLGDHCDGALINGRRVSPLSELKDGDTVKILQSDSPLEVDSDLEKRCMTPKARSALNRLLQKRRQNYAKKIGKDILLQEITRHGLSQDLLKDETMSLILNFLHIKDLSQMFIRIGQDTLASKLILYYFDQLPDIKASARAKTHTIETRNHLLVSEIEKAVHKFSNCCKPYPGQTNVVAALSERGVAFHCHNCKNLLKSSLSSPQQFLDVTWDSTTEWPYPLLFNLRARGLSLQGFVTLISKNSSEFQFHRIEKGPMRQNIPSLFITISLQSFKEAISFFHSFSPGMISVKSFSRKDLIETL